MHKRNAWILAAGVALIAVGCADKTPPTEVALSAVKAAPSDTSYYFDANSYEYRLEAQESRYVVEYTDAAAGRSRSTDRLASLLSSAGFTGAAIENSELGTGLAVVRIPHGVNQSRADVVARLADTPSIKFVHPVLRFAGDTFDLFPLNRIVVKYRDGFAQSSIAEVEKRFGLRVERAPSADSGRFEVWYTMNTKRETPISLSRELAKMSIVEWVTPDWLSAAYHIDQAPVPNDPYFSLQYYLQNASMVVGIPVDVNVRKAWLVNRGGGLPSGGGLVVAVVDEGVHAAHPDFGTRVLFGWDAYGNNSFGCSDCAANPYPGETHGTSVAGIIGASADNGVGVSGIASDALILPIRVSRLGVFASPAQIANGINYAWSTGEAKVINNSWTRNTSCFGCTPPDVVINNAITNATSSGRGGKGTVVVFSAGNVSARSQGIINGPNWPATQSNVISVSSISQYGTIADYAPRGSRIDVVAPSSNVTSGNCPNAGDLVTAQLFTACPANAINGDVQYTNRFGGTSAAAPQVAAIAAMLLTDNPSLTWAQVRDRIKLRAVGWGSSQDFGAGKVDAYRTLRNDLSASISGRTIAQIGDNTYTANVGGGMGPYSYHWYIAYGAGSTTFYDTGNTSSSITQNFVPGDEITFQFVVSDQAGTTAVAFRTAYTQ
jgi:Subtilase family